MLNGDLEEAVSTTFERFKFGGMTPQNQEVFFINLIELSGIKFGTTSPIQYFDNFYNAEMFLRMFGTYSVKISDPLLFYTNVVSKSADRFDISDFSGQYQHEFFVALSSIVSQYSVDGKGVSYLSAKSSELSSAMKETLTEKWRDLRGIDVVSVAVVNFSYDDKSQKIINTRNRSV
jgi:membrane protease subunit (stomatin/prohibitin family)